MSGGSVSVAELVMFFQEAFFDQKKAVFENLKSIRLSEDGQCELILRGNPSVPVRYRDYHSSFVAWHEDDDEKSENTMTIYPLKAKIKNLFEMLGGGFSYLELTNSELCQHYSDGGTYYPARFNDDLQFDVDKRILPTSMSTEPRSRTASMHTPSPAALACALWGCDAPASPPVVSRSLPDFLRPAPAVFFRRPSFVFMPEHDSVLGLSDEENGFSSDGST